VTTNGLLVELHPRPLPSDVVTLAEARVWVKAEAARMLEEAKGLCVQYVIDQITATLVEKGV
jgi:hypothetical protein